jgi:multicomponent Na+:H+ antiporter subunit G
MIIVAYFFLILAALFILFGLGAIFSLKNLYTRILSSATIDTVGTLLMLMGLILISPSVDYVIRLVLLIGFLMITGPISSHVNVRSAYLFGIPVKMKDGEKRD